MSPDTPPSTHDDRGKFLPGNGLGGNPCAGAQMRFRADLQYIAEEVERGEQSSRFKRLARAVFKKALAGEEWAAKELFARLCGKHPNFDDEPPPQPPAPAGDVTINATQVNQYGMQAEAMDEMRRLITIAEQVVRDKIIDQEA